MRRTIFAIAVLAVQPAHAAQAVRAEGVAIAMDEVRTITFPKPVATVYVGNPAIADINMIDPRHAFILGRGYGNTNIVALDHDGAQVANTHISVMARDDPTITLERGSNRLTYSCTSSHCEATPQPGDGKDQFDATNGADQPHAAAAKTAAASNQ